MRRTLLAAALLAAPQLAAGAAPKDFAYGHYLELEPGAPVYELQLPESVYRSVTRSDLGDLRVFNSQGGALPHRLHHPKQTHAPSRYQSLPLFPIHTSVDRPLGDLSVQVITGDEGTVLRLAQEGDEATRLGAYLLDAGALEQPMEALHLSVAEMEGELLTQVRVEASDDLSRWRTVVPGASIARLSYGEHRLQQNVIALPSVRSRYLRLSWTPAQTAPRLSEARARLRPASTDPQRQWLTAAANEQAPRIYEYDTGGMFPIERLQLQLPRNGLASVTVNSRATPEQAWQNRHSGLHYRLHLGEHELLSSAAAISPLAHRYWRIELHEGGYAGTSPQLRMGWTPQRLSFLAAGEPPFLLAFGSHTAAPASAPLASVLDSIERQHDKALHRPARIGEAVTLGGAARLQPSAPPLPWRQWLLWAVLLSAVAVLAAMAWRLYRQLSREARTR